MLSFRNSSRRFGEQAKLRLLRPGTRDPVPETPAGRTEITVVVFLVFVHIKKMRLREFYKFLDKPYYFFRPCLICWLLFANHQNRAVGVADTESETLPNIVLLRPPRPRLPTT